MPEQLTLARQFEESTPEPPKLEDLSPLLQAIANLIGAEAAMALARRYGGTRLYVPQPGNMAPGHPIVRLIGAEASAKLGECYGGVTLVMPHCRALFRRQRIRERSAQGASAREIAREFGITDRWVRAVLSGK